jgi:hypothetical protein
MNLRLLASVKTAVKLVSSSFAIVGWCVSAMSSAQATAPDETTSDLFDADNITPSQIAASERQQAAKSTDRELEEIDIQRQSTDRPKIAQQAPNLLPTFTLSPLSLPFPVQPLASSIPLNSILTADLILAPNNTPAVSSPNAPTSPTAKDARYILAPRELEPTAVDPFSTQFILNGDKISHYTPTIVKTGYEAGNFRTQDFNFNAYRAISANNVQSVTKDVVLRVKSNIEAVGIRSIESERDLTVAIAKQQTLLGTRQQISLDGGCLDNSGRTCTYLPGIIIDDSVIDARKLQPTSVKITSQFGDVISPTSIAAIRAPGFQGGANGENFGIDLNVPAIGLVDTQWSSNPALTGSQQETFKSTIAVSYTRMSQNLVTNGVESGLGRTIRSINYIDRDRNQLLNASVQALGQILPEFQPSVAAGTPGTKIVVNPNLYRVANAIRIPDRSQTVYQSGTGSAISRGENPRIPPGASYQSLWVGLSPVIDREVVNDYYYVTRNAPQVVNSGGGEGGSLPVAVNLNNFDFNSGSLQNAYGQGYVTVYNRNVDRYDTQMLRQRTDYYPHISWTGANLTENTLWRYYTGAIANISLGDRAKPNQDIKTYVGTDYAVVNMRGLSYRISGIGYLNPDPEYASQVTANVQQTIGLGHNPRNNLAIGLNVNYILNGSVKVQSLPVRSLQSSVSAGAGVNLGDISFSGTQFIGNILPESTDTKTTFNLGWKVTDRLNVGLLYTAADRNISTNPCGANLSYEIDPSSNSTLYLGWNASQIDFRRTLGANANVYHDNTFTVSVRYGF